MCLAVPVQIKSIKDTEAEVEAGGTVRKASLILTPNAKVGDYVLLHAGYAINIVNEVEAQQTLALFAEISQILESE